MLDRRTPLIAMIVLAGLAFTAVAPSQTERAALLDERIVASR